MNCCDAWGKCTKGANCPARECSQEKGCAIESEGFKFGTAETDKEVDSEFTKPVIAAVMVFIVMAVVATWQVLNLIFN